jgi:hypothetical protein
MDNIHMADMGYTHIVFVLDRSASMAGLKSDTIGGFNEFLREQKTAEGYATFSLIQFADDYTDTVSKTGIQQVDELTDVTYQPTGCSTGLRDALGRSINETSSWLKNTLLIIKPGKIIFVIYTDGLENSSKEFSQSQITEMITSKENDQDWNFIYMGANQDAIKVGVSMGMETGNTLSYAATGKGTRSAYENLSSDMLCYRKGVTAKVQNFVSDKSKRDQDDLLDDAKWTNLADKS